MSERNPVREAARNFEMLSAQFAQNPEELVNDLLRQLDVAMLVWFRRYPTEQERQELHAIASEMCHLGGWRFINGYISLIECCMREFSTRKNVREITSDSPSMDEV